MLPQSLEFFKEYHDNHYLEFLKNKDLKKIVVIEDFLKQLIIESNFNMCIRPSVLKTIVQENVFKSVFETGRGTTMGGRETRALATKALFNSNIQSLADSDYPKYGYLGCKKSKIDFMANPDLMHQYGSVIVTFKKKFLYERTTLTVGDSINFGECYKKLATFTIDPKAICIKDKLRSNAPDSIKLFNIDRNFDFIHIFYNAISKNALDIKNPHSIYNAFDGFHGFEFFELQYHGSMKNFLKN